jgi:hypothetical protein
MSSATINGTLLLQCQLPLSLVEKFRFLQYSLWMHVMIQNQSSDNQFTRVITIALTVITVGLIYASTLFRKDAYLIVGITFALYGLLKLAKWLLAGVSVDKLDRIFVYGFLILSLIPLSYGVWLMLIHTKIIGR